MSNITPTIKVTITGPEGPVGKTQLAKFLALAVTAFKPLGVETPHVVICDGEDSIHQGVEFIKAENVGQLANVFEESAKQAIIQKVRDAATEFEVSGSPAIKKLITESYVNADEERDSFAEECAMQYGFAIIDDDGAVYGVTAERLAAMMSAFGYRAPGEPVNKAEPFKLAKSRERVGFSAILKRIDQNTPGIAGVNVLPGYLSLFGVLCEALGQAQHGKGAERHNLGGTIPFERQRMQQISELIGSVHGMTYQACKKITEGVALPTLDRQVAELLGAINYLAGMVLFLRKQAAKTEPELPLEPTSPNDDL